MPVQYNSDYLLVAPRPTRIDRV